MCCLKNIEKVNLTLKFILFRNALFNNLKTSVDSFWNFSFEVKGKKKIAKTSDPKRPFSCDQKNKHKRPFSLAFRVVWVAPSKQWEMGIRVFSLPRHHANARSFRWPVPLISILILSPLVSSLPDTRPTHDPHPLYRDPKNELTCELQETKLKIARLGLFQFPHSLLGFWVSNKAIIEFGFGFPIIKWMRLLAHMRTLAAESTLEESIVNSNAKSLYLEEKAKQIEEITQKIHLLQSALVDSKVWNQPHCIVPTHWSLALKKFNIGMSIF